jgi:hypothetical protein
MLDDYDTGTLPAEARSPAMSAATRKSTISSKTSSTTRRFGGARSIGLGHLLDQIPGRLLDQRRRIGPLDGLPGKQSRLIQHGVRKGTDQLRR